MRQAIFCSRASPPCAETACLDSASHVSTYPESFFERHVVQTFIMLFVFLFIGHALAMAPRSVESFQAVTHVKEQGDTYTIFFEQSQGLPLKVEPFFPASLVSPDKACKQLYVNTGFSGSFFGLFDSKERLQATHVKLSYRIVRGAPENIRYGIEFNCGVKDTVEIIDVDVALKKTLRTPWFMSCDETVDKYTPRLGGSSPYGSGTCIKMAFDDDAQRLQSTIATESLDVSEADRASAGSSSDQVFAHLSLAMRSGDTTLPSCGIDRKHSC